MKKLQQEITPILQALKEKNKKEKDENKIKFDEKKTVQPSLLSEKEKAEILLEQEAIKTKNEYLEQNLSIMRSKIKNFSKENQILVYIILFILYIHFKFKYIYHNIF